MLNTAYSMILFVVCAFLPSAFAEETIGDIVGRPPPILTTARWSEEQALLVKEIENGDPIDGYTFLTKLLEHPDTKKLIEDLSDKLPDNSHTMDEWRKMPAEDETKLRNRSRRGRLLLLAVCHAMLKAARDKNSEEFLRLGRVAVNLSCSAVSPAGEWRQPYLRTLHAAIKHRWLPKEVVREVVVFARESNRTFTKNEKIFHAPNSDKQKALGFLRLNDGEFQNMVLFESLEALTAPDGEPCARLEENLRRVFSQEPKKIDYNLDCSMEDGQFQFSIRFKDPFFLYDAEPLSPTIVFTGTYLKLLMRSGEKHPPIIIR